MYALSGYLFVEVGADPKTGNRACNFDPSQVSRDDVCRAITEEEVLPVEEVKVIAVSKDGANVLLQESGKKKGRKRQRPGDRKKATEGEFDSPTSYKNAVVGSVTRALMRSVKRIF
jgi:hypothetical protein